MAGALTEFGRKTTGYKVTVFAVIGVVLGLLYYQFAFKKLKKARDEARQENHDLIEKSKQLDNDAKQYQIKLKENDDLTRTIAENAKALPTEAELPAFFDTLNRKVGESGVTQIRWDYLKEVPIDTYIKVPIEVEVTGSFYQLKRFFSSLIQRDAVPVPRPDGTTAVEERERIVTIENLQIYDPKQKNREMTMTAKFTASTFRQDQAATTPPPDDSGKKPAGAGSGSAAMPPAATPAGAKARTDAALKQSEDRVGSGKLEGGVP